MSRSSKIYILMLGLVSLLIFPAQAQQKKGKPAAIKLVCPRIHNNLSKLAYISTKSKLKEIQLNTNYLSAPIKAKPDKSGLIHLYDPANPPVTGEPSTPVVSIKPSSAKGEQIVLLLPAPKSSEFIYIAKSIAINSEFSYGSSCIVNLTSKGIYLKKDKSKKRPTKIAQNQTTIVGKLSGDKTVGIELAAPHPRSKRIARFYSATWSFSPAVREICLIYQQPGKSSPSTKVLVENKRIDL